MTLIHSTKHICSPFYWQPFIHELSQFYQDTSSHIYYQWGDNRTGAPLSHCLSVALNEHTHISQWGWSILSSLFISVSFILVIICIIIHSNGMLCDVKYCMIFSWETGKFYSWFFLIYPKYCVCCNLLNFPIVVYVMCRTLIV